MEEEEVGALVRALPLRKAPGPDHITNEHSKFGSSKLPSILTVLFNSILMSGHVPLSFRHGLMLHFNHVFASLEHNCQVI